MIRFVFFLLLCIASLAAPAQVRIGAELTAGAAGILEPFLGEQEPGFFMGAGACAEYMPLPWLNLLGGAKVQPRGWETSVAGSDMNLRVRYYNLAIPLSFRLLSGQQQHKTYCTAGAALEINAFNRVRYADGNWEALPVSLDIATWNYSFQGGFGRQFYLATRYRLEAEITASYLPDLTFANGGLTLRLLRQTGD
jgi:hypothetical protein